jgi:hypothetical protein
LAIIIDEWLAVSAPTDLMTASGALFGRALVSDHANPWGKADIVAMRADV